MDMGSAVSVRARAVSTRETCASLVRASSAVADGTFVHVAVRVGMTVMAGMPVDSRTIWPCSKRTLQFRKLRDRVFKTRLQYCSSCLGTPLRCHHTSMMAPAASVPTTSRTILGIHFVSMSSSEHLNLCNSRTAGTVLALAPPDTTQCYFSGDHKNQIGISGARASFRNG